MPYSTEYKKEKFELVEQKLEELNELEDETKALVIHLESERLAEKYAWSFRDYFHLTGTKDIYKVRCLAGNLILARTNPTLKNLTSTGSQNLQREFDSHIERLISSKDIRATLAKLALNEELSVTAIGLICLEYARVMGD